MKFSRLCSSVPQRYYTDIDRDGHEISRFGGLPRELYFPKGLYFPEVRSTEGNIVPRENITILAPPTRDISSVPVDFAEKSLNMGCSFVILL